MVKKIQNLTQKDLTKYVIFSITMVILYTIVEFVLTSLTTVQHDTLTTCWYGFFGGEVFLCAMIKLFKLRREQ